MAEAFINFIQNMNDRISPEGFILFTALAPKTSADQPGAAKQNEKIGVKRFSLVTSGNSLSHDEFETVLEIVSCLKKKQISFFGNTLGAINLRAGKRIKNCWIEMLPP